MRMHRVLVVLTGAAASFVGVETAFAQDGPGNPRPLSTEAIPCPMTLPAGDVDGETMVCGRIQVPENWDDPSDRTLVITYAVARARNAAPFPDPILYFEGGPGISALEEIEWLDDNTRHLRRTRDIIFFDQRGIRYSSNLECPPEIRFQPSDVVLPEGVDEEKLASTLANITLDSDPAELIQAGELIGPGSEVVNCTAYFEDQGIDLSQYGSYENALDAIALMNALDYPSYNLYGISYGSNHAMEVMRYYDENEALALPPMRSVVIDGVIGSWVDYPTNAVIGYETVIMDDFEACEADDACAASYPNIRQRAIELLADVEASPLVIDDTTTVTIADLAGVLRSSGIDPAGLVYLPRLVAELERGDADVFLRLQEGTLPAKAATALPEIDNPFDPISLEANSVAAQMRVLSDEVEELSDLIRRLSEAYDRGVSLPQLFADELAGRAEQLPSEPQDQIAMFLQAVPVSAPDRNALVQAVSVMPETERNLLVSLLGLMDEDDVAEVYAILADPLYSERFVGIFGIIQMVIHCNDRVPDLTKTFETLRATDAPQLIDATALDWSFRTRCEGYGLAASPTEPIVNSSGVPVFISNGALDLSTPALWGEAVYESIANAKMVTFPNLGHGATRKTPCSRDITNAFCMYPEAELNLGCVETLRPRFVLPDDELPE